MNIVYKLTLPGQQARGFFSKNFLPDKFGRRHGLLLPLRQGLGVLLHPQSIGSILHGGDDGLVSSAAAEVAAKRAADLGFARFRRTAEQIVRRHENAGGAEAALQTVLFLETALYGVEVAFGGKSLDRQNLAAAGLHRQHHAGFHSFPIEMNGAGSAQSGLAADVGSS